MDALAIILRIVRETIEASGVPPDPVQTALVEAERRARGSLGGHFHHISRVPDLPTKARIVELAEQGLPNALISERLNVSDRYVRRVVSQLRLIRPD
jgi:DNA-binding NarL/FixJ family response regulator